MEKRKLSPRYRLANKRRKLWKHNREHMEAIRQRAISKAKRKKDIHFERLFEFITVWDKELTTQQLNNIIKAEIKTKSSLKSFKEYLTRRNILRYDAGLGKWINLTHLQNGHVDDSQL